MRRLIRGIGIGLAVAACSRARSEPPLPARAETQPAGQPTLAADAQPSASEASTRAAEPVTCDESGSIHVFSSPATPRSGAPLRVVAVSDRPLDGELKLVSGEGDDVAARSTGRRGASPYFWMSEVAAPKAGTWTARFAQRGCEPGRGEAKLRITVGPRGVATTAMPAEGIWSTQRAWSRATENLYSAWVETLFDAPDDEMPSWPALHEVLRDPKRNFLFDHLGAGEDSTNAPVIRPDCADLPYFLRAYFAFKLRLPFGVAACNRGGGGAPPSCRGLLTNEDADARASAAASAEEKPSEAAVGAFGAFVRGTLADRAHSGSARAPFEEENADYYPVPLAWESLRPGTIFADPYGHVLVVAKRIPQSDARGGQLLAVDGQPDGTVARKRFWRGNFLYAVDRELGGPGFKRFRPVVRQGGRLVRAADDVIAKSKDYGDVSREAAKLDVEGFYDAMDDVLSPRPLDPQRAMLETLAALEEQVRTRVHSVDNGRKWLDKKPAPAPMPEGAEIFETTGAWEDFATPSRDLRLLIAIDVVRSFPARVARRPERYAMPAGQAVKDVASGLVRTLESELAARKVGYTRSDGSPFVLTLAEVIARSAALEMAYNLNDCVELRWGADAASDEASTCRAHAPADQRARMETYRAWFHERRRPPRK